MKGRESEEDSDRIALLSDVILIPEPSEVQTVKRTIYNRNGDCSLDFDIPTEWFLDFAYTCDTLISYKVGAGRYVDCSITDIEKGAGYSACFDDLKNDYDAENSEIFGKELQVEGIDDTCYLLYYESKYHKHAVVYLAGSLPYYVKVDVEYYNKEIWEDIFEDFPKYLFAY